MLKLMLAMSLAAALCTGCAFTPTPPPPPSGFPVLGPPDPANGMIALHEDLRWNAVKVPVGSFTVDGYVAKFFALDESNKPIEVVLVAGPIGRPNPESAKEAGVIPPLREHAKSYKSGVSVCHFLGDPNTTPPTPEVIQLQGGFLYVSTAPCAPGARRAINPWPFIIRTPAMPAGPRASMFVLLTYPGKTGGFLAEHLYRPNQKKFCESPDAPEPKGPNIVAAFANAKLYILDTASMLELPAQNLTPTDIPSTDVDFLKNVCDFVERAKVMSGTPFTWPCGSETHEKR